MKDRWMKRLLGALLCCISLVSYSENDAIGLIIDDVSGDLSCSKGTCTSSGLTLMGEGIKAANASNKVATRTLYIMPDFASFTLNNMVDNPSFPPALSCSSPKAAPNFLFNYMSIPLYNLKVIPDAGAVIGNCIDPNMVIQSYKTQGKSLGFKEVLLLPMFNGSNDGLKPSNSGTPITSYKDKLTAGANKIAQVINGQGVMAADGVAFDIEGSSFDKDSIQYFLLPLAQALEKNNKPVLVFALQYPLLHEITTTPPSNLVAMPALYDYGMSPDSSTYPFQPLTVETYKTQTSAIINGFLVDPNKKNLPIFYVLSGAGSMELWENRMVYNQALCTSGCDLKSIKTGAGTGVVQNDNCQVGVAQMPATLSPIIEEFLGGAANFKTFKSGCALFENQNINSMSDYVGAAMETVYSIEQTKDSSQNFKGFVVYNAKPQGFFAIACSKKSAGNLYGTKPKACGGLYPEGIDASTWSTIFTKLK